MVLARGNSFADRCQEKIGPACGGRPNWECAEEKRRRMRPSILWYLPSENEQKRKSLAPITIIGVLIGRAKEKGRRKTGPSVEGGSPSNGIASCVATPMTDHSGHCDGTEAAPPRAAKQEGRRRGWPAQDTGALVLVLSSEGTRTAARDGRRGKTIMLAPTTE